MRSGSLHPLIPRSGLAGKLSLHDTCTGGMWVSTHVRDSFRVVESTFMSDLCVHVSLAQSASVSEIMICLRGFSRSDALRDCTVHPGSQSGGAARSQRPYGSRILRCRN
jgi:hypothetical protein